MATHKLTDKKIRATRGPARLSDGKGLYLVVRRPVNGAHGTKSWSYLWIRQGRRREMGLGGYPALSLAQARAAADIVQNQIVDGLDPMAERDSGDQQTFGEVADLVLADLSKTWKHPKHGAQWTRALTVLCTPIRKRLVSEIVVQDVLKVVKPVYTKTPETGRRLRSRIERVLDYATAHGLRTGDNPARLNAHFKILLGAQKIKPRKHYPAMPYADIPSFIAQLSSNEAVAAKALHFTILTGARTNETLGALWSEIDFNAALWVIPAERMKAGREHTVPLSEAAIAILTSLHKIQSSDYVFAGRQPRKQLSNMSMAMTLRRIGVTGDVATVHGFRSSFRDWAGDCTNAPREVAEAALAHSVGSVVERSYRRGDALEKRGRLMAQWSDYCAGKQSGDVVQLHG